jgi:prepilin peptidase CpaA
VPGRQTLESLQIGIDEMNQTGLQVLLFTVLAMATVTDLQRAKIPNWLTLPTILTGFATHSFVNGLPGLFYSLQGLGIGFAFFFILYCLGGLGAGDVKLMAAVGTLIGPSGVISALIAIGLVSGACAVYTMLRKWGWRMSLHWTLDAMRTFPLPPHSPGSLISLRFGPVIALGTILSQLGLFSHIAG